VTAHTGIASHDSQEKEATHLIVPRPRSGRVYFSLAAIRAVIQSNPPHDKTLVVLRFHPKQRSHFCSKLHTLAENDFGTPDLPSPQAANSRRQIYV
jgi:hypothetical protein